MLAISARLCSPEARSFLIVVSFLASTYIGASLGSALAGIIIEATSVPAATIGIVAGAAVLLIASAVLGKGRTPVTR